MRVYRLLILFFVSVLLLLVTAASAQALQPGNIAVSKVGPVSAVLVVKSDIPSDVRIDYGTSPGAYTLSGTGIGQVRHELLLDGLTLSSTVYYQVTLTDSSNPAVSVTLPEKSFRTARAPGQPLSFSVAGDNRPWTNTTVQPAVWGTIMGQMSVENLDLTLSVGDIIYGLSTDTLAQNVEKYDGLFAVTKQLTASAPMYTAVGGHEWITSASSRTGYEQELSLPVNNGGDAAIYGEEYYSFDNGDTHFTVLCTELLGQLGYITGNQKLWLIQDLAQTSKRWKVVVLHQPFFGFSGLHNGDPWATPSNSAGQQNRAEVLALFQQYGISAVFSGHDHYYFHHLENGVHYITTGGGGAPLYNPPALGPGDLFASKSYEHIKVDETASTLRISAIDSAGTTLESFTLGAPALSLSGTSGYWASFTDYEARSLSVDYSLANGGGDAVGLQVVLLSASNGVGALTVLPVSLGTVGLGQNVPFTALYEVPLGVATFRASTYVTCSDASGGFYQFPGPAPTL